MSENHPTRGDVLMGLAALPFLAGAPGAEAEAAASSVCFMSAVEMARLIRTKKLSAREALAEHLTQIARVNPKVNAIVTLVPEMAAAAAAKADEMQARGETLGALHGLPVAHKDLLDTRGIRTTFGSPLYKDNIPTDDEIVVERMRRAGAITIGKTNTPEFGSGSQTFNTVFGATRNPYDLHRRLEIPHDAQQRRARKERRQRRRDAVMRLRKPVIPRRSATSRSDLLAPSICGVANSCGRALWQGAGV